MRREPEKMRKGPMSRELIINQLCIMHNNSDSRASPHAACQISQSRYKVEDNRRLVTIIHINSRDKVRK